MIKYLFQLGKTPLLSLAEIHALLPEANLLQLSGDMLLLEMSEIQEPRLFLNRLGGTIKIIEVTATEVRANELADQISTMALNLFQDRQDKIRYALTVSTLNHKDFPILKKCLLETKKKLKSADLSSRFINNNFQNPTTALLKGENVLNKGAEFNAVETKNGWVTGKTIALQDIDAYSERDYNRPERDPRLGMLPPKLAQILINLTGIKSGSVYDPFCGLGTILMEAGLMGLDSVGSDLDAVNVNKCQKNLEWIWSKAKIQAKFHLFNKDATNLTTGNLPENIGAIASETFLGPPMSILPPMAKIESVIGEISYTMSQFLEAIHPLIKAETPLVLTLLAYQNPNIPNKFITLKPLLDQLEDLGYEQAEILPAEITSNLGISGSDPYQIIYKRPDQIVARAVVKLVRI